MMPALFFPEKGATILERNTLHWVHLRVVAFVERNGELNIYAHNVMLKRVT